MTPLTVGSLFAGIGGFDAGLEAAGMRTVWQVEKDPNCLKILSRHWPNAERHTDVCEFPGTTGHVRPDVICGGFPCQDLSVAGKRAGLAGSRSGLFFEFMRIAKELSPRWVLVENVPGLLSSNRGRDMGTVLGTLAELGYGTAYRVLDAQWFGVPQRRRRVFIVGCLGDWRRAAEVLFESESLPWDSPPSREAGARVAGNLSSSAGDGSGGKHGFGWGQQEWESGYAVPVAHTLRAEGFDASEDGTGRGVPLVPMAFDTTQLTSPGNYSNPQPGDPCHPLAVGQHAPCTAFDCKQSGEGGEVSPPLRALSHDKSHANAGGQVAVAFQTRFARNGRGAPEEICPTLQGADAGATSDMRPCVAWRDSDGNDAQANGSGESLGSQRISPEGGERSGISPMRGGGSEYRVRRLTPVECERLQGFPDHWTRYAADGTELADGPRYRMLGNAVAVPVAKWIGERILEAHGNTP